MDFSSVAVSGAHVDFTRAVFAYGEVNFGEAAIDAGQLSFAHTSLQRAQLSFGFAKLRSGTVVFDHAQLLQHVELTDRGVPDYLDELDRMDTAERANQTYSGLQQGSPGLSQPAIDFTDADLIGGVISFHNFTAVGGVATSKVPSSPAPSSGSPASMAAPCW